MFDGICLLMLAGRLQVAIEDTPIVAGFLYLLLLVDLKVDGHSRMHVAALLVELLDV
ncbi:hypothetical protein ACLOJK_022699 [Asimina triloba]